MNLAELLLKVGDENVRVQNLRQSISSIQSRKDGGVAVTFLAEADKINPTDEVIGDPKWIGLVVWLPHDRVQQAMDEPRPDHDPQQGGSNKTLSDQVNRQEKAP